ncbi:AraC family transcriptional regulator [Alteribacillus sp. HJP-4]|uniref:AraC family transcriptional regulator n=1 Tax=Alteribacillus sp. HJP-4 TaxID=2775394 RepID=UPI0035CD29F2
MKAIRKRIESSAVYPFYIVYRDTKHPKHELPNHLHDWYEIIYVHKGNGVFFIDQAFFEVTEGDLVTIPSNTIHRAIIDHNDLITSTAVFFNPAFIQHGKFGEAYSFLALFDKAKASKNYQFHVDSQDREEVEHYLEKLVNEDRSSRADKKQAVLLWLHTFLLHINRHCLQDTQSKTVSQVGPSWFIESLSYIENHLDKSFTLEHLAKKANVSSAHFSRSFKQLSGMNVSEYITVKRMHLACDLLSWEGETVQSVAERCGFRSMPHFYRTFKKFTSFSPNEYRKKIKEELH